MTPITATTSLIDTYLSAYGEPDGSRRRALIADSFAPDATVADPPMDATGEDGLDEMFVAVQAQFPGHTFRRTSGIDEHHGAARYEWQLVAGDGTVAVEGADFVRFSGDKIASVTGFFGPMPALDTET